MRYYILFLLPLFISCDPKAFDKLLNNVDAPLTDQQIGQALKDALNIGVDNSVDYLSKENGYYHSVYKIVLPDEARVVIEKLKFIPGFSNLEEEAIRRINLAAEDAAKSAGPIFGQAIRSMTIPDAMNILMGEKDAATRYLHDKTYQGLYDRFNPIIVQSLNKFGALDYWADAVEAYNKLPFVQRVNPDLADHVCHKSLYGLFDLIEQKELDIRTNIAQRTTDLLRRAFKLQD